MDREPLPPEPVEGHEIGRSVGYTIFFVIGSGLMFLFCGFMILAWVSSVFGGPGREEPRNSRRFMLVVGLVGLGVSSCTIWRLLRSLWVRRRLVIGRDRIQVVERADGEDMVVAQIPLEAVERVKCTRVDFGHRVDVEFDDLRHPELYLPGEDLEHNFTTWGYHYSLPGGFRESPQEIVWLVNRARKKWRRREGPEGGLA